VEVDQDFLVFLKRSEGVKPNVYPDSNGVPTIGIGHKLTTSERRSGKIIIGNVPVRYSQGLDTGLVHALCRQDTKIASDCINRLVKVPLTQNQFNVLVSFTFNEGTEAFRGSTLLKMLNNGLYEEVPGQLTRWVYDDGEVIDGLIRRRKNEINLWNEVS
jgi:lysozyme